MPEAGALTLIFVFILGSAVGSFLNVCIYRLPLGESIVSPPSHCPSCGKGIRFYHNIPILGYLLLRGRCADCGSRISPVYPGVEIISGAAAAAVVIKFGAGLDALGSLILIYSLVVITFIDLRHMIIPNVITIPGAVLGLIYNALNTDWGTGRDILGNFSFSLGNFFWALNEIPFLDSVFGLIAGGGILLLAASLYLLLRKREGMGMGDVKLLAMIGAFVGLQGVVFVLLASSLLGTVVGVSVMLYMKRDLKYALPFGPFLSIAAVIYIFTGGFTPAI